jgi:hypothetical protein
MGIPLFPSESLYFLPHHWQKQEARTIALLLLLASELTSGKKST